MIPQRYAVLLKDNNGNIVNYIENKISLLNWDWDRIGGCGACNITLNEKWDAVLAGSFAEDYGVEVYAPVLNGTAALRYSGFIDRVSPQVSGRDEKISLFCLGYVNQLKRAIVRDFTFYGMELGQIAKYIVDTYVTSITQITSTAADYEDTLFSADTLYFNESAYDCINKLADIAGKREWGVRADKSFFFKARGEKVNHWFNITEDFISFNPQKDFNPMITSLYLIGGEGYNDKFLVTNRVTTREAIVTNSSIVTQSVGNQFARMYLKDKGVAKKSYSAEMVKQNNRLESTIPLGLASVNIKVGIQDLYDNAVLYDSGRKYNGGTEYYQIEKINYSLQDDNINVKLNFGPVPSNLADEINKLEYLITAERNS